MTRRIKAVRAMDKLQTGKTSKLERLVKMARPWTRHDACSSATSCPTMTRRLLEVDEAGCPAAAGTIRTLTKAEREEAHS